MQYRRVYVEGGCYFFTLALADRKSDLLVQNIDHLRAAFKTVKRKNPFEIDAIVVLPDHLHCLWTLPHNDCDYSMRWSLIKANFSRRITKTELIKTSRIKRGERGIWQHRFWEHTIRDEKDFYNHIEYIHHNPVKRDTKTHVFVPVWLNGGCNPDSGFTLRGQVKRWDWDCQTNL